MRLSRAPCGTAAALVACLLIFFVAAQRPAEDEAGSSAVVVAGNFSAAEARRGLADVVKPDTRYTFNFGAFFQGGGSISAGATTYGNWCGGPHGGLNDCCGGRPCSACQSALQATGQPSAACMQQCPTKDNVDNLCMIHDFCCVRLSSGNIGSCSYSPLGVGSSVGANNCACDQALYNGVVGIGGTDGFKANLKTWLTSSWAKCFKTSPFACVPVLGTVSPTKCGSCCWGFCWTPWCCTCKGC